jgi:hypothetical protein
MSHLTTGEPTDQPGDGAEPPSPPAPRMSDEDAQEYRAYLQRGETRLSTLHRVAGSFLSGAGLLTLLPVLLTAAFSSLVSEVVFLSNASFPSAGSAERWLALIPVLVSLGLPLAALVTLIRDLVEFYFTPHHFGRDESSVVYPRFILSGIRVSDGSLSEDTRGRLSEARSRPAVTDLLVPRPLASKERLLREAHAVNDLNTLDVNRNRNWVAEQLREFIFRYTASDDRSLDEEAAKMEASLARHHLLLRALVLRYAKAFLLTILTLMMAVAALTILGLSRAHGDATLDTSSVRGTDLWIALLALYAVWSFAAAVVVRRPIVWIYRESDSTQSPRTPQSLVSFERITLVSVALTSVLVAYLLVAYGVATPDATVRWIAGLLVALFAVPTIVYCTRAIWRSRPHARPGSAAA